METRESENHDIRERAEPDLPTKLESVRVFEADAWIPMWEQSIPGVAVGTSRLICSLRR